MNTIKNSSYGKLIAFFLIAISLLSVLVVSANGWQTDNSKNPGDDISYDNQDNGSLPNTETPAPQPDYESKKFYHHITGIEISEDLYGDSQVAYVIDSDSPLYGIFGCNVLVEFPLENERTRFLMIGDMSANLQKIGSITYSRHYISNIAKVFGASIISLDNDDIMSYNHLDTTENAINLIKDSSLYYKEYTYFSYTSPKLLINRLQEINSNAIETKLPYTFSNNASAINDRNISASNITIPYATHTSLAYKKECNTYVLSKMGSDKIDISTSEAVTFNNVLILFCDSVTYETTNNTQLVMHTMGQGTGYYASAGMAEMISWSLDENGQMTLLNKGGEILTVERGNFYIAYVKSSRSNYNIFS